MDIGEIWEEHKKFIVAVGAALVVFFIGTRIVNSMYVSPANRLDASAARLASKLRKGASPDSSDLRDARNNGEAADERLAQIEARISYAIDPRFRLEPGADFDLVYNDRYREVRDAILQRASIEDVDIDPSIGMPDTTPQDRVDVERHLKALDQIRRVLGMAMDNGVVAIPFVRMLEEGRRGFLASQAYLERTRVEYEMTGSADSIFGLVEALQAGDTFLGVTSCRITLDPKAEGLVRATLEVVAIETDPDAPATLASADDRQRNKR